MRNVGDVRDVERFEIWEFRQKKPKMAYSCDLADMDCHGLSWMTFMDDFDGRLSWMTFMAEFHGRTFMDDFHG